MVDWSGPQTSRNRSHGTVKHSVKLLGVGATAPDWYAVLCSRVDQCQGGDFQGLAPIVRHISAHQCFVLSRVRSNVSHFFLSRQNLIIARQYYCLAIIKF